MWSLVHREHQHRGFMRANGVAQRSRRGRCIAATVLVAGVLSFGLLGAYTGVSGRRRCRS